MSIYETRPLLAFCVALAAVFGAVMGSFLNCAAWRIVHGESFVRGRSHCPACGHALGVGELIPVLSWAIQRGRCRWCGAKLSARYPLTELGFALVTVLCLLKFDLTALCLRNYVFLCCLFLLTLTDLEDMIIPDGCHVAAVLAWLVALPLGLFTGWKDAGVSLLSALAFGGGLLLVSLVMDRALKKDSMGGGDIKLFAVVGLYLGFIGTLLALMVACVLGLAFHALSRRGKGREFPFGPSIAAAAAAVLLYGGPLIEWYRGLLR